MSTLPMQDMTFTFGAVEQNTGVRKVRPGNLVEATNVRFLKNKEMRKRRGFVETQPATSGFGWTSTVDSTGLVPGPGGTLFTLDGAGRAWCYDPDTGAMLNRGQVTRVFPQDTASVTAAGLSKPTVVVTATQKWTFAIGTDAYYYQVSDLTTGLSLQPLTKVAATGIIAMSAASDLTRVILVWAANGVTASSAIFVIATPTVAPTTATYATLGANDKISGVDMFYLSNPAKIAVILSGTNSGTNAGVNHRSYSTSGGVATSATNIATANRVNKCPSISVSDGNTQWYYSIWQEPVTGAGNPDLVEYTVNTAAMTVATLVITTPGTKQTGFPGVGATCGYVRANGDRAYYEQYDPLAAVGPAAREPSPWNYTITEHVRGSVSTDLTWCRGAWIASKPVLLSGTSWYMVTGFEDDGITLATSIQDKGLQRTCNLRDISTGGIVSQALSESAGGLYHRSNTPTTVNLQLPQAATVPSAYSVNGTIVSAAMMDAGTTHDLSVGDVTWDFSAAFGMPCSALDRCLVPNGIPFIFGAQENLREITPLVYPGYFTVSAGGTLTVGAVVYRFTSPDGRFWRSSAVIGTISIANGATVTVPTLRNLFPGTLCVIEWYAGTGGVANLQQVKDNDPTVDSITFTHSTTLLTDEPLYTTGGGLDNEPLPPCRHVANWKNRIFLAATNERDTIWPSVEFEIGSGLRFNAELTCEWSKGTGPITAIADGGLYLVLFRLDAIGLITGEGPDGNADGGYQPETIGTVRGLTNWRSLALDAKGVYFEATDGLVYQVQGTTIADCYQGMQDYADATGVDRVTAAMVDRLSDTLVMCRTAHRMLALDITHTTDDMAMGQWANWINGTTLPNASGAAVDSNGKPWVIDGVTGWLYSPTEGIWTDTRGGIAPVLMKVKTAPLAPAGLGKAVCVRQVGAFLRFLGASNTRITVESGSASSVHSWINTPNLNPLILWAYPPALTRIVDVQVTIEELTTIGTPEGFLFEALTFNFQVHGGTLPAGSTNRG